MDLNQLRPQKSGRPLPVRRKQTVGIDLGTTNTVVARNFEALPMQGGGFVMPSAVAYPPNGSLLVGKPARNRRAMDPKNTILSAKRIIGARWHSSYTTQFRDHYPYDLVEGPDGWAVFNTRAGKVCPVEVGAHQQARKEFHHRYGRTQALINKAHFQTDISTANHQQALGNSRQA